MGQGDAEKDAVLQENLKLIMPAFGKLKLTQARIFVDSINECLKQTPFMYLITGDGLAVVLRREMVELAKAMFNRP